MQNVPTIAAPTRPAAAACARRALREHLDPAAAAASTMEVAA